MNFRAIIYDMDGVLIDSEHYWDVYGKEFFESRGVSYTRELKSFLTGKSLKENIEWMKVEYGWTESVEELLEAKLKKTEHIYNSVANMMPGADALVKHGKKSGLEQAIASGSHLYRIEKIVQRFQWSDFFDALVSSDHVSYVGKPEPDIYLYAARTLRLDPAECVVIEDSVNGVAAAKAAGMKCIAALDDRWSWGDYSAADLVVHSLEDSAVKEFIGI